MPASPKAVSGLVKIMRNAGRAKIMAMYTVTATCGVRFVACARPRWPEKMPCRAIGYMMREPALRHDSEREKKLTMAPMETGIRNQLTL